MALTFGQIAYYRDEEREVSKVVGSKPTIVDQRLVDFVMHQLIYGPEKNVHVVARQRFLDGIFTPEFLSQKVEDVEKEKLKLFDETVSFMLRLGITITETAKELETQGMNREDRAFMDRLLAEVNTKIEEVNRHDLFLP